MQPSRLLAEVNLKNPAVNPIAKFSNLGVLVDVIVPLLQAGIGLVGLAMMMYGAFKWITASGDPQKLQEARKTITWSIVGIIFVALSYLLIRLVLFFTGTTTNPFNPIQN